MAKKLTGMEIFKLLPKTNCGECGVPTCMAFAMKLSQKNAELSSCPYADDKAKEVIGAAGEPPIRLVRFGDGIEAGNELVMFRHEKTFVHQTVLAYRIASDLPVEEITGAAVKADGYCLERVGEKLRIESVLIDDCGKAKDDFLKAVKIAAENFKGGLILKSNHFDRLTEACESVINRVPLLHAITCDNLDGFSDFLAKKKVPAVIKAANPDEAYRMAGKLAEKGLRDFVLEIPSSDAPSLIQNNTIARKSALAGVKQMGYPILNFVTGHDSAAEMVADGSACLCKYASILVIDRLDHESLLPLMMLRQNVYTDPQKPIQMEPGIYKIGDATPDSPLVVTTNFSLTYFIVSGEIESSGVPAWLAITDSEGMSVLTAWAAGKFSGEKIAGFLKVKDVAGQMTNRKVIIPGYVACISGELEENMTGWEILVGPQEASDIAPFMKRLIRK